MNTRNEGFTLVETLIVVVLGAVVMSSIYQMVIIQEKTTRHQYAVISTNENVQTALAVLTNDLKEISSRDGDIIALDSTDIQFRALRKAGVVCRKSGANDWIDVWEMGEPFAVADNVVVFADGVNLASQNDDTWLPLSVSGVAASACPTNPLAVANTRRVSFAGAPLANVQVGALVRSFVLTRFRMTDNGEWGQLMRTEAGVETPIIEQLSTLNEGGLRFRYFDATGAAIPLANLTARRADVMRMQIKVAGKAATSATKTQGNRYRDSLLTQVYLRGNFRTQ